ncbi:MAG: His-Xaa-Ser system radical SAM maturase HxsB, partial [Clostridia bacterium]|nr:His-Xaa-Ser system radical SAM maturase HxsB [Clostridia bacterium]
MINYFNFKRFDDDYLLTNDLGRYMFVSASELKALLKGTVDPDSDFGKKAIEEMFWYQGSSQAFSEYTIPYMRESKNYLFSATSLHIFVVTNKCNMKCVYCQAQNGKTIPNGIMTRETAQKAVDIALSSPAD